MVIGKTPINIGENMSVAIQIDTTKATPKLYVMLHDDFGQEGVYEFPGVDTPVQYQNAIVNVGFEVTNLGAQQIEQPTPILTPTPIPTPTPTQTPSNTPKTSLKEFTVVAKQWSFEPSVITVDKGDNVKISITSLDVEHGFSLPEYNIDAGIKPGKTTLVEFTANKAGTFTFSCNVYCGTGHKNMKGTLKVED